MKLTAEQDHQRILDLLHISSHRAGPDSDPASPHAANFDQSKANPHPTLPDPLVLESGEKVTTAKVWWTRRRPEILEDLRAAFESEVRQVLVDDFL